MALERLSESYSSWRSAIWSGTAAPAPRPIADPHLLVATLQRAVAETANEVCTDRSIYRLLPKVGMHCPRFWFGSEHCQQCARSRHRMLSAMTAARKA